MARTETDFGGGVDKAFDNDFITRKELEDILKQRATTDRFYELEPLEVLDIFRQGSSVSQPGAVIGRYVYSEQGDSVDECLEYVPLDSNIQQHPIVGEVYFGLSFKGQRYYFGRIAKSTEEINSQDFNISGLNDNTSIVGEDTKVLNSDNVGKSAFKQGDTFVNDNPSRLLFSEGDTTIEGRFKNSIRLGNDDKLNSGNIKIVAGCQTGIEDLALDKSSLYMTSDEIVDIPEPALNLIEQDYSKPQLVLDSDRIVLNAKTDEIGLFSEKDINISSEEGDVVITSNKVIELKPKGSKIINNVVAGGIILDATKNGIPFPQLDMMGFLKMVFGIKDFFQALLLGIPKLINPFTIPLGVREIIRGFKGIRAFIQAVIGLEFLSISRMETKTIEEIKAVLPIPAGFAGIIDDISNITDEQLAKLKELEEASTKQLEKASQLTNTLSVVPPSPAAVGALLADGSFDSFDGVEDLKTVVGEGASSEDLQRYIDNGGISSFETQVSDIGQNIGMTDQAKSYQGIFNKARS